MCLVNIVLLFKINNTQKMNRAVLTLIIRFLIISHTGILVPSEEDVLLQ